MLMRLRGDYPVQEDNTSGSLDAPLPPEVRALGFCWGACILGRFWSWAMDYPVSWVGAVTDPWRLGTEGYEIAWRHRRFASFGEFRETMAAWDRAALVTAMAVLLVVVYHWRR